MEINVNEIRIGNYFSHFGFIHQVEGISKKGHLNDGYRHIITKNNLTTYLNCLKPIKIKKELLKNLPDDFHLENIPNWIKHIHELQNWYWVESKCQKELQLEFTNDFILI